MARNEVAVVGAGITGLSIGWHLLERGLGVVIHERTGIGAGQSGVQPGGVRQQWGTPVNCMMARDSLGFYRELQPRLGSSVNPVFRPCGYLFLAHSRVQLDRLARNVELQRSLDIASVLLDPAETGEIAPALEAETIVGASFYEDDGYFDRPQSVVEAFAEAVVRRGADIQRSHVTGLVPEGSGWRLQLADGTSATAERVVVAAGCDARPLLALLGVDLPIRPELRYLFFSDPVRERLLEPLVISPERRFAAKQLADGRLLASDLSADGDAETGRDRWRARIRANIEELLPRLTFVSLPLLIDGVYDVTPDHQAVLGEIPHHEGLFVAAGFSGHGFMMAPEVGRGLAALMSGEDPGSHFADLAPDRFARGVALPEPKIV